VLALDNVLMDHRVRSVFHSLPSVQLGLDRLGFRQLAAAAERADELQKRRAG